MVHVPDTDRLVLRPIGPEHADLLVALDADPEVVRFVTGRPSTREEVGATIRAHAGHRWVAFERDGNAFVGWFGLTPTGEGDFDVGYRLARRHWGRGLATEGARALLEVAFSELGARRVTAQTMAVNRRSRRVMERCGMRHVRTFHLAWDDPLPGTEQGEVEYEITADRWRLLSR